MDCKKIREEFIEYLEGSLPRGRHETFEKHLADCGECKKEFEAFKALTEKVAKHLESQASSLNPPAMLWGKILKEARSSKKHRKFSFLLKPAIGIAACLAILLAGVFTPVFGAEGNLINYISSNMINSAANDLESIYQDEQSGGIYKTVAIDKAIQDAGLTGEQYWDLRDKGLTDKDILIAAYIKNNTNTEFDNIVGLRLAPWGWGRIANHLGVSVFSVDPAIASPIIERKRMILDASELEINAEVLDHTIVPMNFGGPIPVPQDALPVDQSGNPMSWEEVKMMGCARMRFEMKHGAPGPRPIIMPGHCPNEYFETTGNIADIREGIATVQTPQGPMQVRFIEGETAMMGEIGKGMPIRVRGLRFGPRMIARFVAPMDENKNGQSQPKNPKDGGNNTQTPSSGNKTGENKSTPKSPANSGTKDTSKKTGTGNKNQSGTPDYLNSTFETTLKSISETKITTDVGQFLINQNTLVTVKFNGNEFALHPKILSRIAKNTKLTVSTKNGVSTAILIPNTGFSIKKLWMIKDDFRNMRLLCADETLAEKIVQLIPETLASDFDGIQIPSQEIFQEMRPGNTLWVLEYKNQALHIAHADKPQPPEEVRGEISEKTGSFIVINGKQINITSSTECECAGKGRGSCSRNEINVGDKVVAIVFKINGKIVATKVVKMPKGMGGMGMGQGDIKKLPKFQIESLTHTQNGIQITFKDGPVLLVTPKTAIRIIKNDTEERPGSPEDLKTGMMVGVEFSNRQAIQIIIGP